MSKKKSGDATVAKLKELKEQVEECGLGGGGQQSPWPEQKRRAVDCAVKAGSVVERILFGRALESQIMISAKRAVEACEQLPILRTDTFLATIAGDIANKLARIFRDENEVYIKDDALELALSFLYLFPKLWKALDKPLTLDKIRALDFDDLLVSTTQASPCLNRD